MRVWIDLTNSPHVLLFAPIVRTLRDRGDDVLVTVRRFAQTVELAEVHLPGAVEVGAGSAKSLARKIGALGSRIRALLPVVREFRPDVAVSHGSDDQAVAARLLRVPSLVSVDYEYQPANHLSFRMASRLLLPEAFAQRDIDAHGGRGKTVRYHGLKEEAYLKDFCPSAEQRTSFGLDGHDGVVVVLRPPPEGALYHRGRNPLWDTLIDHLGALPDTRVLVLPRHPGQVAALTTTFRAHGNATVVSGAVNGPALVWWADVVISGGGTMNREAVALGTPVWSLFSGRLGSVDRALIGRGVMRHLTSPEDVRVLTPAKRERGSAPRLSNDVLGQFVASIDATAERRPVPARAGEAGASRFT